MKGKYTEIEVGKILNLWRADRREPQKVRVVKIINKDVVGLNLQVVGLWTTIHLTKPCAYGNVIYTQSNDIYYGAVYFAP